MCVCVCVETKYRTFKTSVMMVMIEMVMMFLLIMIMKCSESLQQRTRQITGMMNVKNFGLSNRLITSEICSTAKKCF